MFHCHCDKTDFSVYSYASCHFGKTMQLWANMERFLWAIINSVRSQYLDNMCKLMLAVARYSLHVILRLMFPE